jgi:hypothetical protein
MRIPFTVILLLLMLANPLLLPVSALSAITNYFTVGVGIFSALASILASLLIGPSSAFAVQEAPGAAPAPTVEQELGIIRNELAIMRQLLEKISKEVSQNV